jgi:cytochrome c2
MPVGGPGMKGTFLLFLAAAALARALDTEATLPPPAAAAKPWADFVEPDFPFFNSVLDARKAGPGFPADNLTPRGIVLQLGHGQWACFDTDLLRISAAWTGEAVTAKSMAQISYQQWSQKSEEGQTDLPKPAGTVWLANGLYPGWQTGEKPSLLDPRPPAPSAAEVGRGALDPSKGQFRAVRLVGRGVELEYLVAGVPVRETLTTAAPAGGASLVREFFVGPATQTLLLVLAEGPGPIVSGVAGSGTGPAPGVQEADGVRWLAIPPHSSEIEFSVTLSPSPTPFPPAPEPRAEAPLHWPAELATQGRLSPSRDAYVVDNIELPLANPWRRNVRPTDIQFFPDGSAAVVTFDGDVWMVHGLSGDLSSVHWRRFASGFNEALGLAIRGGEVFVFDRDGIWRLTDSTGRGEADRYELFSNAFSQTAESREYAAGIKLAPDGSFVIAKGGLETVTAGQDNGTVLRVSADGRRAERLGWGFRNPLIGVDPQTGLVTASDQEGNYIPASPLYIVAGDTFHGYLPPFAPREGYPAPIADPLTWIPHNVCPSTVSQVWLRGARMGPLNDSLILVSYYFPELFRVLIDSRGDRPHGAVVSLTKDFRFAPLNAAVNPSEGFLYVAGMQIWGTAAEQIAGLARVRFTGAPSLLARAVTPVVGGVLIEFDSAVDPAAVVPEAFEAERWDYHRTYKYGSLHYLRNGTVGQEAMTVAGASLSEDGHRIFVALPAMGAGYMQMVVRWEIRSVTGQAMASAAYFSPEGLAAFAPGRDEHVVLPGRVHDAKGLDPAVERGRHLTESFGCVACHSADGTARAGPTWKGLFGNPVALADGSSAIADESYIRGHLRPHPKALVRGFVGGMPDYSGLVTPEQTSDLIEYLRSLR